MLWLISVAFALPEVMTWDEWQGVFGTEHLDLYGAASGEEVSLLTMKGHWEERKTVFDENVALIQSHNAKADVEEETYRLGVNQFAALTKAEYKSVMLGCLLPKTTQAERDEQIRIERRRRQESNEPVTKKTLDPVDWRQKGVVTPPKSQGSCGSCWAFSTTGAIEGAVAIETGKLTSLSEQQLMDCSLAEGDHSCQGGLMDFGFEYVEKNGGLDTEADYPYLMADSTCQIRKAQERRVSAIKKHVDVKQMDEDALAEAVTHGPVSVAIEADQSQFQLYKSGVFTADCGTKLDHGVLAVGMGTDNGQEYWIVKNSWGGQWGEEGYIRLAKGQEKDQPHGKCGICTSPSYPIAASPPPTLAPVPTPKPVPSPQPDKYENPNVKNGCGENEIDGRIQGIPGSVCMPHCKSKYIFFKTCPPTPEGFVATAQCMVQEQDGTQLCGLKCDPDDPTSCNPSLNCHCRTIQNIGLCTYDDAAEASDSATSSESQEVYYSTFYHSESSEEL